ncbi:MAG: hypothetical protein H0V17_06850 [Deltaproteobacteria bacterium]|nr:hypothetical protein [Deltaproteobacteria bacterium]
MSVSRALRAAADLTRPAPLIATALLAVNDHVLKGSGWLPGAVTGKLSDVAGLFVAPIALVCVVRCVVPARRDGHLAAAALAMVALGFALLKTSPAVHAAVNVVWGHHVLDPSDLWCLPSVLLAWVWLGDRERHPVDPGSSRFGSALALVGTLVVCAATSKAPPVPPPQVPMWSIAAKPLDVGCGTAAVWVAKSGKTGVGVTVRVTPRADQPCVAVVAASLKFADRAFAGRLVVSKPAGELLANNRGDRELAEHANATYHYLAFELDNEARWNRGDRMATFELAIEATGAGARVASEVGPTPAAKTTRTWSLPATHAFVDFPVNSR